jgi:hypothetical protein
MCPQIQRQGFDALTPGPAPIGEDVMVDLTEQPLDQGLAIPRIDAAFAPPSSSRLSAASRISSSVRARRGPGRRRRAGAAVVSIVSIDVTPPRVEGSCTSYKSCTSSRVETR